MEATKGLENIIITPEENELNKTMRKLESDISKYWRETKETAGLGLGYGFISLVSAGAAGYWLNENNIFPAILGGAVALLSNVLSVISFADTTRYIDRRRAAETELQSKRADPIYESLKQKLAQLS